MNPSENNFPTVLGYHVSSLGPLENGIGGQGEVSNATWSGCSGKPFVLKIYNDDIDPESARKRTAFLIAKALHKRSSLFYTPIDQIIHSKYAGHIAPFAEGMPIHDFLASAPRTLMQTHCAAIALGKGINLLHNEGLCHGDIKPSNILCSERGTAIVVKLIDLCNFRADKVPLPPSYGDPHYSPPEIIPYMKKGLPAAPDKYGDYFAFGVVLHILLLFIHPSAGNDKSEKLYKKAMWEGKWLLDPYSVSLPKSGEKMVRPPAILNASLASCFRSSMSLHPAERTSPTEWLRVLLKTSHEITACPDCGKSMYFDPVRKVCPYDNRPFSSYSVVLPNGSRIPIDSNHVVIGRDLLKSPCVSSTHALLKKLGNETYLESHGRHGTSKLVKGVWMPVKTGVLEPVAAGMRFRLADVEVAIEK